MPSWFELARWFQRRKSCKWGKRLQTTGQQVNVAKNVINHQWPMGHVALLETVRCDPQISSKAMFPRAHSFGNGQH